MMGVASHKLQSKMDDLCLMAVSNPQKMSIVCFSEEGYPHSELLSFWVAPGKKTNQQKLAAHLSITPSNMCLLFIHRPYMSRPEIG